LTCGQAPAAESEVPRCTESPGGARRSTASKAGADPTAEQTGGAAEQQPPPEAPWYVRYRSALLAAVALPAVGGFTYWVLCSPTLSIPERTIDIKPITEEVFDRYDNLLVFFLDAQEELLERREDIQRAIRKLQAEKSLFRLRYYHNVRKEGDPPVPEAKGASGQEAGGKKPIRVVMYKGQRKGFLSVGDEVPVQEAVDFFALLSEELPPSAKQLEVPRVSGRSFPQDVLDASGRGPPVLLQMYEDTCFLCFLMRPFVNSLAELLKSNNAPIVFKRLNIEKNDFPDGCPVARGTPTFVLFRGPGVHPDKWDEFKPKELVDKLVHVFPAQTGPIVERMEELQGLVSKRFQLFTQLVMWTMELQKLERMIGEASLAAAAGEAAGEDSDQPEDAAFNSLVSEMMAKDMKRIDGIDENLAHLQKEVDEVEHDAALMGSMLGEAVLRREKAEEERWASQRR